MSLRDSLQRYLRCFTAAVYILVLNTSLVCAENADLREDFSNLQQWKPLEFPKINAHSNYEIVMGKDGETLLKASSKASASGLIWKKRFNIYKFPRIKWRWKINSVYTKGNALEKSGDDYPLRIYVIFNYDPQKADFWMRARYSTAKLLYGQYPPHSSLNYIWANRPHKQKILNSAYTDSAKLIVLQAGAAKAGSWVNEEVNALEDYREAFGGDPPEEASLAVMNDSDNTGESSVSFLEFIEVIAE